MTVDEFVSHYQDLLILQYRNKPKALGTLDAVIRPVAIDLLPQAVENAFNIDTAIGDQLDILGIYIGADRRVLTFSGAVDLDDNDYRTLLKIKISLNNLGSSLYDIMNFIAVSANNILYVFDHKNMQMSFYINSNFASLNLAQALIRQKLLPKPMGVSYSAIIYLPNLNDIFGFQEYTLTTLPVSGFNTYEDYNETWTFLSYEDALVIPI